MKYAAAIARLSAASAGWIGFEPATPPEDVATAMMRNGMNSTSHQDPVWVAYEMLDLEEKREASGRPWLPFLDVSTLNAGLYVLPAGGTDSQQPHQRDEVYYVLSGRGVLDVEGEEYEAQSGSVIYVKAHAAHHFHSMTEELKVLVFFSKAETAAPNSG